MADANPFAFMRLRDADQEAYGGPEWIDCVAGIDRLSDLDYDGLKAIEDQVLAEYDTTLIRYIATEYPKLGLESFRVRAWLGLLAAGVDIKLVDFKPNGWAMQRRSRRKGDASPPAKTSGSSPISTETTIPESETSTDASTPGSPSTTA